MKSELEPAPIFSHLVVVFDLMMSYVCSTDDRIHSFVMSDRHLLEEQSMTVHALHEVTGESRISGCN